MNMLSGKDVGRQIAVDAVNIAKFQGTVTKCPEKRAGALYYPTISITQ